MKKFATKCLRPNKYGNCRKCQECVRKKQHAWYLRLRRQHQLSNQKGFMITLTFRDEPDLERCYEEFRKYKDRLKKGRKDIKHYFVVEYGEKRGRIHLHGIFYNLAMPSDRQYYPNKRYYGSQQMTDLWGQGWITMVPLNKKTLWYPIKYLLKSTGIYDRVSSQSRLWCSPALGWSDYAYTGMRPNFCIDNRWYSWIDGLRQHYKNQYVKENTKAIKFWKKHGARLQKASFTCHRDCKFFTHDWTSWEDLNMNSRRLPKILVKLFAERLILLCKFNTIVYPIVIEEGT